jgi:rhodanese-related sulfurtransferase
MLPVSVPSVTAHDVPDDDPVLDVRERDEWDAGHVPGATHVPLAEVPARLDDLITLADGAGPGGSLVVVCRSGGRSARAVAWLVQNGVDAVNLDGGMGAWAGAARAMVSESGEEPFVR